MCLNKRILYNSIIVSVMPILFETSNEWMIKHFIRVEKYPVFDPYFPFFPNALSHQLMWICSSRRSITCEARSANLSSNSLNPFRYTYSPMDLQYLPSLANYASHHRTDQCVAKSYQRRRTVWRRIKQCTKTAGRKAQRTNFSQEGWKLRCTCLECNMQAKGPFSIKS